jgi:hypothetical protein
MPLLALALVVGVEVAPDGPVIRAMYEAVRDGSLESDSYQVGYTGGTLDGHSECKRMSVGLGAPPDMNAFESAVRSPTLGSCEVAVPKLMAWAQGEQLSRSYDYYRYWHGSSVLLRPSVVFFGVDGTRLLAAASLVIVTVWLARLLAGAAGRAAAAVFLTPLLLTTDFLDLPGALVHAIGMIVAIGAAALLLRFLRPDSSTELFAAAGFAAGGTFLFFADLTNPDAAWALAATSAAVVAVADTRSGTALRRVVATSVGWIAGSVWLWAAKWLVASLVLGFGTVLDVVRFQTEERLAGDADGLGDSQFDGLRQAWGQWWDNPLTGLVVAALLVVTAVVVWRRRDLGETWPRRLIVAVPAVIPLVWHAVMRQHTFVHGWFTHRSLAVAFGILLLALTARVPSGSSSVQSETNVESATTRV